jgi:hypothetical protein
LANTDQTNEDQTTDHTNHTYFNTASTKVPTLTQHAVSTIYNLQPDQTVTEFQPIVHLISVEKLSTNCKRRVVTISDGKYTIKGYLHLYHPDITCGNIIRVTNYQVKTSILGGSLYININDYDTMGTYDKPMESTPFNINRVEKWNLIMDLAKSNPCTSVNAMIHDRQQDLDYSSKNFTTLYKLQDQISLLRAQNEEVERRNSIGIWTDLLNAGKQLTMLRSLKYEMQRRCSIGLWSDLITAGKRMHLLHAQAHEVKRRISIGIWKDLIVGSSFIQCRRHLLQSQMMREPTLQQNSTTYETR